MNSVDDNDNTMTKRVMDEAYEFIAAQMNINGISMSALAKKLGVSRQYIHQLFNFERPLTLKSIVPIADALGFDVSIIFIRRNLRD